MKDNQSFLQEELSEKSTISLLSFVGVERHVFVIYNLIMTFFIVVTLATDGDITGSFPVSFFMFFFNILMVSFRLRNMGKNPLLCLLLFVPIANLFIIIWCLVSPTPEKIKIKKENIIVENNKIRVENNTIRLKNNTIRLKNNTIRLENYRIRIIEDNNIIQLKKKMEIKEIKDKSISSYNLVRKYNKNQIQCKNLSFIVSGSVITVREENPALFVKWLIVILGCDNAKIFCIFENSSSNRQTLTNLNAGQILYIHGKVFTQTSYDSISMINCKIVA
jgi:hypothetical protein